LGTQFRYISACVDIYGSIAARWIFKDMYMDEWIFLSLGHGSGHLNSSTSFM